MRICAKSEKMSGKVLLSIGEPTVARAGCIGCIIILHPLAHGALFAGDTIQSINGWNAVGHQEATKRMKRLTGELRLTVMRHAVERSARQ